jgi:hypothetical protein
MTVERLAQFDPLVLGALTMLQLSPTESRPN